MQIIDEVIDRSIGVRVLAVLTNGREMVEWLFDRPVDCVAVPVHLIVNGDVPKGFVQTGADNIQVDYPSVHDVGEPWSVETNRSSLTPDLFIPQQGETVPD